MKTRLSKISWLIAMGLIFIFSCTKDENPTPEPPTTYARGYIISVADQGILSPDEINQILSDLNFQTPFALNFSVKVLSITYSSVDKDNRTQTLSGTMLLPQSIDSLPLLSIQNGTESKRDRVASVTLYESEEGLVGLMTASMGYLTVIPDYPGFGVSNVNHPYMHATSLIPSVIDLLKAAKNYSYHNSIKLNQKLFLTGYSEGGFVTLTTQKVIEEQYPDEFQLTAVAPMAGPYDLYGMIDSVFMSTDYKSIAYIGYFFSAYNKIYGWNRLDEIINSSYNSLIPELFNGSKTWGEIVNLLPANFSELMNSDFVSSYNNGNEPDFENALLENTVLDWSPVAPIHFFHGDSDNTVPYQNVLTAIERLSAKGSENIQLTTIPEGNHETSGLEAIIGSIQWFETF